MRYLIFVRITIRTNFHQRAFSHAYRYLTLRIEFECLRLCYRLLEMINVIHATKHPVIQLGFVEPCSHPNQPLFDLLSCEYRNLDRKQNQIFSNELIFREKVRKIGFKSNTSTHFFIPPID